jgi:hypothetical protein
MRIPRMHYLTRELVRRFELTLEPFVNTPHAYFVEDKRINYNQYTKGSPEDKLLRYFFTKFNVDNPKEMIASTKLMVEALKKPLEDFAELSWKDLVATYDRYSMKHWLAQYANVSDAAIAMGSIFYNIEPWLDNGLVFIFPSLNCSHE